MESFAVNPENKEDKRVIICLGDFIAQLKYVAAGHKQVSDNLFVPGQRK